MIIFEPSLICCSPCKQVCNIVSLSLYKFYPIVGFCTKIFYTSHFPSLYTVSPSHPRFFFHANFSASPTPILEEEPSSNTPIIHVVDVNFDVQQQYSKPEPENLNEFLCGLFEDPKTKELAFDYYQRLKERPEFRPEKPTLKHVIRYLVSLKSWDDGCMHVMGWCSAKLSIHSAG